MMPGLIKQGVHDLAIYDNLITSLITLKVILEDIDRISVVIDLELDELELLQEELRIITLKNTFL